MFNCNIFVWYIRYHFHRNDFQNKYGIEEIKELFMNELWHVSGWYSSEWAHQEKNQCPRRVRGAMIPVEKLSIKKSEYVSDEKSWVASLIREIVLQEWNEHLPIRTVAFILEPYWWSIGSQKDLTYPLVIRSQHAVVLPVLVEWSRY